MNSADELLFHASATGKLMVEPKKTKTVYYCGDAEISTAKYNKFIDAAVASGDFFPLTHLKAVEVETQEVISETTKGYLIELFVEAKYGREKEISNKYIEKGLKVEEDSITLYSLHTKNFFKKNTERITNEFLTGEPDLSDGNDIRKAAIICDVKSSWDIHTFFKAKFSETNKDYYWQGQSYMALTGAKTFKLVYCLVNTPDVMIADQKRKLSYQMGQTSDQSIDNDYIEACAKIDALSNYDDIPIAERINEITIERNDADIERLYARIKQCREYMNKNLFKVTELTPA